MGPGRNEVHNNHRVYWMLNALFKEKILTTSQTGHHKDCAREHLVTLTSSLVGISVDVAGLYSIEWMRRWLGYRLIHSFVGEFFFFEALLQEPVSSVLIFGLLTCGGTNMVAASGTDDDFGLCFEMLEAALGMARFNGLVFPSDGLCMRAVGGGTALYETPIIGLPGAACFNGD
jgi:hypothetical protein